jgi:uncharacterized phiE125 gp8 family phage protein
MHSYILTAPTAEPVNTDEVKDALRIDGAEFDPVLPGLIASARAVAEVNIGRALVAQTIRYECEDWPTIEDVLHVYRPTAAAVSYWDGSAWVVLAGSAYVYAPHGAGTIIAPAVGTSWPTLGDVAVGARVRIDLTTGLTAGNASQVPDGIKTFIVALVGQLIEAPSMTAPTAMQHHPLLARLLDPWRVHW